MLYLTVLTTFYAVMKVRGLETLVKFNPSGNSSMNVECGSLQEPTGGQSALIRQQWL